jgi:two-component system, OmpR family, response regulator MprA
MSSGGAHLLVVDDEPAVREALRRALELEGYRVELAEDGADALARIAATEPDALVLDILMPVVDGLTVARRLRGQGNPVPILMLTARDSVGDRVAGLDAGADDYLVKPFDVGELQARLRALLRRSGVNGDASGVTYQELRLDGARHGVSVGDSFVELTRTEYQLLELLMMNAGRILPHNLIYERVWGYDFGPSSNALRVYIGYLRRKLEQARARPLLHTVRGVGYVLREP